MSKRNKLEKFADLLTFSNVYEYSEKGHEGGWVHDGQKDFSISGKWNEHHFKNDAPIVLELACGRGEYTVQLAEKYTDKNFIGVDVKGARIWKGAKHALENLPNAAFLRIRIEHVHHFFAQGEVDEIWITFPDPFLKDKKANRRLTSPPFLELYKKILKENALIHLKTDDDTLYNYTLEVIEEHQDLDLIYTENDIYSGALYTPELEFKTYYEHKHLEAGKLIKYVRYKLKSD